jgi:thiol-disulfide isomerase/thioredoxin
MTSVEHDDVAVRAADIDESFVPRARDDISFVELDGELVVAAPATIAAGQIDAHWLDRTASLVWGAFDGEGTVGELIDELSDAFSVPRDVVRDDVLDLVRTLGRVGLLDGVAAEPPPTARRARPEGLPVGAVVAPFELEDARGGTVTSDDLVGRRLVLVNWSPTCGYCLRIAPDLAELEPVLRDSATQLLLVASGDATANERALEPSGLAARLLLGDIALFRGLGTPCAYIVDSDGRIASELAVGANEVPALVREALGRE